MAKPVNTDDLALYKKKTLDVAYTSQSTTNQIVNAMGGESVLGNTDKCLIYYGYALAITKEWTLASALGAYANYGIVVFGGGMEEPTHEDHQNLSLVFKGLASEYPTVKKVGYVPIGAIPGAEPASNWSLEKIKASILKWRQMGANGIFLDEYGYDYCVTRERQNSIVSYCHRNGLFVIANSWQDNWIFSAKNDLTLQGWGVDYLKNFNPNPDLLAPVVNSDDYVIFENNIFQAFDTQSVPSQNRRGCWSLQRAFNYYQGYDNSNQEYGMPYYKKFHCKAISLNGIYSKLSDEEKKTVETFAMIACRILNIDAIAFSNETWGAQGGDDIISWDYPKFFDIRDSKKHNIETIVEGGLPIGYKAEINGNEFKVLLKKSIEKNLSNYDPEGQEATVNGSKITNVWIDILEVMTQMGDIQSKYDDLVKRVEKLEAGSSAEPDNYVPKTDQWVMSNGRTPTKASEYDFEATFTDAWQDFHVVITGEDLAPMKGKTITYGFATGAGASTRLEIDVNDKWASENMLSGSETSADVDIPADAASVKIRAVCFAATDLHAAFTGVYIRIKK